jgi:hypothetical protein
MKLSCFSLLILAVIPTEAPAFLECGGLPPLFTRLRESRIHQPHAQFSKLRLSSSNQITDSDVPDP